MPTASVTSIRSKSPDVSRKQLPSQLLALGLMLEGDGASLQYVAGSLNDALRDADKLLGGIYERAGAGSTLEQSPAQSLVHDAIAETADYKKLEAINGADPAGAVSDGIDKALWLGIAIAARHFSLGGVR